VIHAVPVREDGFFHSFSTGILTLSMPSAADTFYAKDRRAWRAWLQKNHSTSSEIWLIYFKKHTGQQRLAYNDAVEEALCFGWIDGMIKPIDPQKYMQRFSPRKVKSRWSSLNKQRVEKMIRQGLMTAAGLQTIAVARKNGSWDAPARTYTTVDPTQIPGDLAKAFSKNKRAKTNFENFSFSTRKQFLSWITSAKRDETREARIKQTLLMSAANKRPTIKGFKL